MKPFEIFSWQPEGWPEPHPCVIVSHASRAANKPEVEVVLCSSQPPRDKAKVDEVILDEADKLDRPTLCKCGLIYAVNRNQLGTKRGEVSLYRRGEIIRRIIAAHGWPEVLAGN
jgi:hypothetical protein